VEAMKKEKGREVEVRKEVSEEEVKRMEISL